MDGFGMSWDRDRPTPPIPALAWISPLAKRHLCECALIVLAWAAAWTLTPALRPESLFTFVVGDNPIARVNVETEVALGGLLVAFCLLRRLRPAMRATTSLLLYLAPFTLALLLPLDHQAVVSALAWAVWAGVCVLWQGASTFGVVQTLLHDRLSPAASITLAAVLFALGHLALDPGRYSTPVGPTGIGALGSLLAWSRHHSGSLHPPLALHAAWALFWGLVRARGHRRSEGRSRSDVRALQPHPDSLDECPRPRLVPRRPLPRRVTTSTSP